MVVDTGAGEPVVFVHGNGSTHETWRHVIAAMGGDVRCIAYDLRGHAPTAEPFGAPTIDDFVADLEALRTRLGLPAMHLVGQSFGAFIVAAYALAHPTKVRSLVLIAAPAGRSAKDRAATDALIERFRRDGVMAVMRDLVHAWYTSPFLECHPEALAERLDQIGSLDETVFIETYRLYGETEIMPWLGLISAPALVMTGEFARGCDGEAARRSAGQMRDARLVILDDLKNGLLTEAPARVASEIRAFVRQKAS